MVKRLPARYSARDESSSNVPPIEQESGREAWLLLLALVDEPCQRVREIGRTEHPDQPVRHAKEVRMLYWALMFLVVAIIAAVLGFTGIAIVSAGIAKLLFFVFVVLFVITLVAHLGRRGSSGI